MTKIVIYESAMCCSSGVCGPNPDKELIELQDTIEKVQKMGCEVERYSIAQSPKKFRENPEIIKLIQQQQIKALPITTFAGSVIKVGSYPSIDELQKWLKDSKADLPSSADKNNNSDICCSEQENTFTEGCCVGQNSCDIRCGPNYTNSNEINIKGKCC